MKSGYLIFEDIEWISGQYRKSKSSLIKQSYIETMLQLKVDRDSIYETASVLTNKAISNCKVVTRKYAHVWDIDILFNHWAAYPADQMLANQDLQIKLASLLLSVFFLRIIEILEIDLNLSNFYFGNHTALITLSPKTINALEQYEVKKTGILNLFSNLILFTLLERLREHFHQEMTTFPSPKIGIGGLTAYSIKHASTFMHAAL
ncbi:MAG: hypothetical protein EZS28_037486 [Streblomastix strix]|uniref:Tyr recombinase domain-containing protein n=1 Tax=Streblomastix strix TaxID=222440 RepID=A0A5J4U7Y2_9EUKA|nr:MAG: hypothetical protein EZS28_037486 [Streblomastix strix]